MVKIEAQILNLHLQIQKMPYGWVWQISKMQRQILNMQMDRLKILFESGDLVSAQIVPALLSPGPKPRWVVEVKRRNGAPVALSLNRKKAGSDEVRIFNSLDAAFSAAAQIGFRSVKVTLA